MLRAILHRIGQSLVLLVLASMISGRHNPPLPVEAPALQTG